MTYLDNSDFFQYKVEEQIMESLSVEEKNYGITNKKLHQYFVDPSQAFMATSILQGMEFSSSCF